MCIDDDLPIATSLSVDNLKRVRDLFQDVAIKADGEADHVMADWARVIADKYSHELNMRARSARDIQRYIAERRRERPHGTPGDTDGLPSWPEVSGPPGDG